MFVFSGKAAGLPLVDNAIAQMRPHSSAVSQDEGEVKFSLESAVLELVVSGSGFLSAEVPGPVGDTERAGEVLASFAELTEVEDGPLIRSVPSGLQVGGAAIPEAELASAVAVPSRPPLVQDVQAATIKGQTSSVMTGPRLELALQSGSQDANAAVLAASTGTATPATPARLIVPVEAPESPGFPETAGATPRPEPAGRTGFASLDPPAIEKKPSPPEAEVPFAVGKQPPAPPGAENFPEHKSTAPKNLTAGTPADVATLPKGVEPGIVAPRNPGKPISDPGASLAPSAAPAQPLASTGRNAALAETTDNGLGTTVFSVAASSGSKSPFNPERHAKPAKDSGGTPSVLASDRAGPEAPNSGEDDRGAPVISTETQLTPDKRGGERVPTERTGSSHARAETLVDRASPGAFKDQSAGHSSKAATLGTDLAAVTLAKGKIGHQTFSGLDSPADPESFAMPKLWKPPMRANRLKAKVRGALTIRASV